MLFLTGILLIFSGCFTTKSVNQNAATFTILNNTAVYDSVPDDSLTIALIKPYKATMEAQMSEYIATIDSPFSNAFFVGNLGRLAADYMLMSANAISIKEFGVPCHFAISNNGGFRTGFYPGPVTMQQLTQTLGTPGRTLHQGFVETFGTTPMAYLRTLRLSNARHDLLTQRWATVTETAMQWNFFHLGRFSQDYQRIYGETPSQTFRRNST